MSHPDTFSAVVHSRIDDLRREAAADAVARSVRRRSPARRSWPEPVVRALREAFGRGTAASSRRGAPCPTC